MLPNITPPDKKEIEYSTKVLLYQTHLPTTTIIRILQIKQCVPVTCSIRNHRTRWSSFIYSHSSTWSVMSFQEGSCTRSASTKRGLNPTVNIVWLVEAYSFPLAHGQWTRGNSHLIKHVASTIWVKLVWIPLLITNLNKRFTLLDFPATKPPQTWKQSLSLATQPRTRHVICKFQDFFQRHLRWPIQGKRFSHLRDKSPRCPKLEIINLFPKSFQISK